MPSDTKIRLPQKARTLITDTWQSQANLTLFLVMIVLFCFILPVLGFGKNDLRRYSDIVFSIALISGVAIAWGRWVLFTVGAVVSVVTMVTRWRVVWNPDLQLRAEWASMAAIMVIVFILLAQIFRKGRVSSARVQGAIAVYLLFGVAWAHAYHIAATLQAGSFNHPNANLATVGDWVYYSFVTLSTLGYGDIVPVATVARTLSVTEALTGQLYLAVLIARLLAMEVISWQERAAQASDRS